MSDTTTRAKEAHALLFSEGGALTYARLTKALRCDQKELMQALDTLAENLENTGLTLVRSDTEALLAIAEEARDVAVGALKEEQERDIGEAGLEVLAILLYEGPSTRAHIDYIRGVNSSSTLRTLLSRGLIERSGNPADGREYLYKPTTDLLAHLGVRGREELPEYATIAAELKAFKAAHDSEHERGRDITDTNTGRGAGDGD